MADGFIGRAWVQVSPSFTGFQKNVKSELGKALPSVGKETGKQLGDAVGEGAGSTASQWGSAIGATLGKGIVGGVKIAADVGAVATVAFTGFAVQSARAAMRVDELNVAMQAVGKSSGVGFPIMERTATAVKSQGIEMASAEQIAIGFARANLNMADASKLARVAQDAAVISQTNSTDAADQLMHGIETLNTRVLRQQGILVDANSAYATYAAAHHTTAAALTETQKQQAFLDAVLEQGTKIAGTYEMAMEQPGKLLRSFPRLFNDAAVAVGQSFTPALGAVIKPLYDFVKQVSGALEPGGKLAPIVKAIGDSITTMLEPLRQGAIQLQAWFKALDPASIQNVSGIISRFGPQIAGVGVSLAGLTGARVAGKIPLIGDAFANIGPKIGAARTAIGGFIESSGGLGAAMKKPQGIMMGLAGVFGILMAVSPEFRAMVITLAQQLIGALMPAFQEIMNAVKPLLPVIILLARTIGLTLARVLLQLMPVIIPLVQMLGGVFATVIRTLAGLFMSLMPVILPLVQIIGQLLVIAITTIVTVLRPILPIIVQIVGALAQSLMPILSALTPVFQLLGTILGALAPIMRPLAYAILAIAAAWGIWAIAQFLLDAAMSPMMPLFLAIVAGIALVVAGVILLIKYWGTIAGFFQTVAMAIWNNGLKPAFDGIMIAVNAVAGAFVWFYQSVILPVWNGIKTAIGIAWAILKPIFDALVILFKITIAAPLAALWLLAQAVWNGIVIVVVWAWQKVIQPIFGAIMVGVRAVAAVFSWIYNAIILPVWNAISAAISWAWNAVIHPIMNVIMSVVRAVGAVFSWLYNNVIQPVWNLIKYAISLYWNYYIHPILTAIMTVVRAVGDVFSWLYNSVIKPVWDKIGSAISWTYNTIIKPIIDAFKNAVKAIPDAFRAAKDTIGKVWDEVRDLVKKPIKFVVDNIINPLIKGVNWLITKIGMKEIKTIDTSKWHKGGKIPPSTGGLVPGGWGGGDRIHGLLEPGEWVLTKRQARAIGYGTLSRLPHYRTGGPVGTGGGPHIATHSGIVHGGGGIPIMPLFGLPHLPKWVPGSGVINKGIDGLAKLGTDAVDAAGKFIREAGAKAFEAMTKPLKDLIQAWTKPPYREFPDQWLARFMMDAIQKTIDFIKGKSKSDADIGISGGMPNVSGAGAQAVWKALRQVGFTEIATAGIMGNMQTESNFDPFIVQGGGHSNNPAAAGGGGYGLVQWTPGAKLIPLLHGKAPSIATEVAALAEQLRGSESGAGKALMAAKSPSQAAEVFGLQYERYAGSRQPARESQAEAWYRKFKGTAFDAGGFLPVGTSIAVNRTGRPEPVLTSEQWAELTGGPGTVNNNRTVNVYPRETQSEVAVAAAVDRNFGWMEAAGGNAP